MATDYRQASPAERQGYASQLEDVPWKKLLAEERDFLNELPSMAVSDPNHSNNTIEEEDDILDVSTNRYRSSMSPRDDTPSVASTSFSNMDLHRREHQTPSHTHKIVRQYDRENNLSEPQVSRATRRGSRGGQSRQRRTPPQSPEPIPDRRTLPSDVSDASMSRHTAASRVLVGHREGQHSEAVRSQLQPTEEDFRAACERYRARALELVDSDVEMREIQGQMLAMRMDFDKSGV